MMGKVFLLNPPSTEGVIRTGRLVRKSKISTQSWQPIHLAYATGLLEKASYECMLYDASVTNDSQFDVLTKIRKFKPDHIAYYWAYDTAKEDLEFANKLGHFWDVTLVGPWSAHMPDALSLFPKINAMTFGDFEYTLLSLYGVKSKQLIQGLKYREDGEIIFNPQGEPLTTEQLDNLPFVSDVYKRHLDMNAYHQTSFKYPFTDLFSARSCPYRCVSDNSIITMANQTEKILSDIKIGDVVKTLNSNGIVMNKKTTKEQTLDISLDDGKQISCTLDHKFMTKRGWVEAQYLTEEDEVLCLD